MTNIKVNSVYKPLLKNDTRYEIIYGGAGSGKSKFVAQKKVIQHLRDKGRKTLVIRKVGRTIRNSVFAEIKQTIYEHNLQDYFKIPKGKTDYDISCVNGNQIIFTGLDDAEKLKSITGITDIWIEEATEITEDDFKQIDLRPRGATKFPKQITLTFNPVSALSWIKKFFFDRKLDNCTILKTTYKDNKFIDEDYKKMLDDLKHQDYVYYKIYALGEWGVLGNLIFTNWEVKDLSDIRDTFDRFYNGLDFGFSQDPASCIHMHYDSKRQTLYILDELYEKELTNDKLARKVTDLIGKQPVVCDSAEPKSIRELREFGVNALAAKKGKDSINFGIDWLKRQKIIVDPRCQNTINELQQYKWREDKDGNVLKEPIDEHNHAIDAIRYGTEHLQDRRKVKATNRL